MSQRSYRPTKAYRDETFINSVPARPIRILAEYLEPMERFEALRIEDTVLFFGSARIKARDEAEGMLASAATEAERKAAEQAVRLSIYYEATRELAKRLTLWSKGLKDKGRRFVVCSGGGPGIMEAANRGASEAQGENVGLGIALPFEQSGNTYITRKLAFEFHYFFMRKFWFMYLAKALVIMPGGFGTLDELFEVLTLLQTKKTKKVLPIVLFGTDYWDEVIDIDAMARFGTISPEDVRLVHRTDSVDDAFTYITERLQSYAMRHPGGSL
ncbi:MAG TPA: LOG family protein [Alphaproteobacteria bacterium]|jgi:uncharacterized protein (TIGR00730 family)|nr:LOG family protein [Alphaproteobacteria bacterium]